MVGHDAGDWSNRIESIVQLKRRITDAVCFCLLESDHGFGSGVFTLPVLL